MHFFFYDRSYTLFYKQHFLSNSSVKFAKNQVKAKENPEAELLLFENYSLSSSTLSSKNNRSFSKKCIKTFSKKVCLLQWGYINNNNENVALKIKNWSQDTTWISDVTQHNDCYLYQATSKQNLKLNSWKS